MIYYLCFYLHFLFIYVNTYNFCSTNKNCNIYPTNKYSKELNANYQTYRDLISEAKKMYAPCNRTKCACHKDAVICDLKIFENGITQKLIKNVKLKGTLYQIIKNSLYRDEVCMFPARCAGIEHFLLKITSSTPDIEFIINTRDWPQVHKQYGPFGPVFSFSKTSDYHDIMYPAWSFWEGGPAISLYPRGIGRWDIYRQKLGKLGNSTSWDDKISKVFFRGSRTSSERDSLILLSRKKPELVDARYTKNQAWKSDADTLHAFPAEEVSFEEHCKYKYLFNFRGVAASFRFKHILLCKSLVFHVGNDWLEFFYPALKPWVHYIPVEPNATEDKLLELIHFVKQNDALVKEIAENGYNMIWNNLKMKDVICYWRNLLRDYAKLLTYKPVLDKSLIRIN